MILIYNLKGQRIQYDDMEYLKARRRKHRRPLTLHQFLRRIVWPIGEEREVGLWVQLLKQTPNLMMGIAALLLIGWAMIPTPSRTVQQLHANEIAYLVWAHLCGKPVVLSATNQHFILYCTTWNWLPAVTATTLLLFGAVLKHIIKD